ncbi:hypothetical protein [Streptomyces sp. RFCAC02]|uniref:hypothetical protein n=1 Tax=Streptomyces sp. RFCAC02 TaxID=2499143 RepID=UPI0019D243B8|nr:hypothetical protein [Streptomyces sp. RFCAC02]
MAPGRQGERRPGATQTRITRLIGLVPRGTSTAARTPFVLLIVLLLGSGMLGLLLLNASLNEGSFQLSELRRQTQELEEEQQELQAEVDAYAAPDALADRAAELGMVPGGPPAFLGPDGSLLGETDPTPAPSPAPTRTPDPDAGSGDDEGQDAGSGTDSDAAGGTSEETAGEPTGDTPPADDGEGLTP